MCLQHCTIYSILLPLNIPSKDKYLLHGKITTQCVIRTCTFQVSCCNILGSKTVLYFGTPFATQNRQVSTLTKRSFGVLVWWTHCPTPHTKLLICLVIQQRLRCKMASGQMLCVMKSYSVDLFLGHYPSLNLIPQMWKMLGVPLQTSERWLSCDRRYIYCLAPFTLLSLWKHFLFSNFCFPWTFSMKIHDLLFLMPTVLCKQWWEAEWMWPLQAAK